MISMMLQVIKEDGSYDVMVLEGQYFTSGINRIAPDGSWRYFNMLHGTEGRPERDGKVDVFLFNKNGTYAGDLYPAEPAGGKKDG